MQGAHCVRRLHTPGGPEGFCCPHSGYGGARDVLVVAGIKPVVSTGRVPTIPEIAGTRFPGAYGGADPLIFGHCWIGQAKARRAVRLDPRASALVCSFSLPGRFRIRTMQAMPK